MNSCGNNSLNRIKSTPKKGQSNCFNIFSARAWCSASYEYLKNQFIAKILMIIRIGEQGHVSHFPDEGISKFVTPPSVARQFLISLTVQTLPWHGGLQKILLFQVSSELIFLMFQAVSNTKVRLHVSPQPLESSFHNIKSSPRMTDEENKYSNVDSPLNQNLPQPGTTLKSSSMFLLCLWDIPHNNYKSSRCMADEENNYNILTLSLLSSVTSTTLLGFKEQCKNNYVLCSLSILFLGSFFI